MPLTLLRFALLVAFAAPSLAQGTLTIRLEDFAAAPLTGFNNPSDNSVYAARINFLREEPGGGANRLFVCDLNGRLYVLDQTSKQFTTYLDFNRNTTETPGVTGLFPAFTRAQGYANGLVTFQFDPDYRTTGSVGFGKFYTVHIELDTNDGAASRVPNASAFPGFVNAAYTPTAVQEAPGNDNASTRQAVLIEWQDTNPANTTFEGTARELLRVEFNGRIHPMGDLAFNPRAVSASSADWRKLYIAVGDGGAGEQNNATLHATPQRRDVLQGKILRISPDDPDGAGPLRYGIPADNPFVGASGTREEIYAYGFRNPHRLAFDPLSGTLLAADIGFHSWEEVNIVRPLANYGWSEREGTKVFNMATGLATGALPADDAANGYVYPVIQYAHSPALGVGDAIAGGFVYRGSRLPALRGKYVFGDITTGELFYADLVEMMSADDGNAATLAPFHRLEILWDNPRNGVGLERFDRMYEIVAETYRARGGTDANLPGSAVVSDLTGGGRADIRFGVDHAGELFVLSKSDGMIRSLAAVVDPTTRPVVAVFPDAAHTVAAGGTVAFSAVASDASSYQWRRNGVILAGATAPTLTLRNVSAADAGAYVVDVANAAGVTTSGPTTLGITAGPASRLVNFSARANAGSGNQSLILGFARDGAGDDGSGVLIRGLGPSLSAAGVTGPLADPQLQLFRGSAVVSSNDNWATNAVLPQPFGVTPPGAVAAAPNDAALFLTSATPGSVFTAHVRGASGSGIALAEAFDVGSVTRQLVNTSARAGVGSGENAFITGFVLSGTTARTVLIRAAGPALTGLGLSGALADPQLTLYRGGGAIAENDNWRTSPELVDVFTSVGAFDFIARSKDSVLYLTLAPGSYTAHVTGVSTLSGVVLLEVYVLP